VVPGFVGVPDVAGNSSWNINVLPAVWEIPRLADNVWATSNAVQLNSVAATLVGRESPIAADIISQILARFWSVMVSAEEILAIIGKVTEPSAATIISGTVRGSNVTLGRVHCWAIFRMKISESRFFVNADFTAGGTVPIVAAFFADGLSADVPETDSQIDGCSVMDWTSMDVAMFIGVVSEDGEFPAVGVNDAMAVAVAGDRIVIAFSAKRIGAHCPIVITIGVVPTGNESVGSAAGVTVTDPLM